MIILIVFNWLWLYGSGNQNNKIQTGKFTSISIDVTMKDAQEIVDKYQEVATIKGIISL
jgi:putative lipoic acid-binding regulatory protein